MWLSHLLVYQFSMVATMDITIPPKLIITCPSRLIVNLVLEVRYFDNMIFENNWVMIRESKKRMGPIASNQLILNTCHSTSNVNATTTIPTVAAFPQIPSSTFVHRVDSHLSNISCSCVGFKYMTRGFWQNHSHTMNKRMNNDQHAKRKP